MASPYLGSYAKHPDCAQYSHVRRRRSVQAILLAASVIVGTASLAATIDATVKREIEARSFCATLDFDALVVNVEDGVVEVSANNAERVRTGDHLVVRDVDASRKGVDVEIEFESEHTRSEVVDVEIQLYRSIRGPDDEFVNQDELWKAVSYFAEPCAKRNPPPSHE